MTLSRFFVIHVMILPAALMGLAGLHLFLFRAAGPAGPFRGTPEEIKAKTDYFFPRQVWKDIVGMARRVLHYLRAGVLGAGGAAWKKRRRIRATIIRSRSGISCSCSNCCG